MQKVEDYGLCYISPIPETLLVDGDFVPNPDYDEKKSNYYAYFSIGEATGKGWDLIPYEIKSEPPVDTMRIPFGLDDSVGRLRFIFPHQQNITLYSPYSVYKINCGMVPWIFIYNVDDVRKYHDAIYAGINPDLFLKKLKQYETANKATIQPKG